MELGNIGIKVEVALPYYYLYQSQKVHLYQSILVFSYLK